MISDFVKDAYNNFYKNDNEQWRMLGAKYKAQNIFDVCKSYSFKKVLEVGSGDGSILYYLDKHQFSEKLYAVEISQSGIKATVEKNIPSVIAIKEFDGYQIPFGDKEFDAVIISHVLEHVEFERRLLREIQRVSKFQIIEVPKDYKYGVDKRIEHFLKYGHINIYTPTSLRYLLKSEGFEVLKDKTSLIPPEVTKHNLYKNQRRDKSIINDIKIDAEYYLKKALRFLGGKKQKEKFANAYTVLAQKTSDLQIF